MMRLPPFRYVSPHSLEEAAALLGEHGPEAAVVAGGSDLYPKLKRRQLRPAVVVGLQRIAGLRGVRDDSPDGLAIGALTSLRELAAHPAIRARASALARAASVVASPHIRRVGTVGGNLCLDTRCSYYDRTRSWRQAIGFCLKADGDTCWVAPGGSRCWAIASSDLAPAAVALDARLRLVGAGGERIVPAAAFYRADGLVPLAKETTEIVAEVLLPETKGLRSTYLKLRARGSIDFPALGVAVAVQVGQDGTCTAARVVLGAVAPAPLAAVDAERALVGRRLTPDTISEAAAAAARPAKPLRNADLGHGYRKRMIPVYVRRALEELASDPAGAAGSSQ